MGEITPDSPATSGVTPSSACVMDEMGDYYENAVQDPSTPRATAMKIFADEIGVEFQDVRCRVAYMRPLTRQESYDHGANDRVIDNWLAEHAPLAKYRDGVLRNPDGQPVEVPEDLDRVPDDWRPDEDDPAWEWCGKDDPGAMRCWRLEEK